MSGSERPATIVAGFDTREALQAAMAALRTEGLGAVESYTPSALPDEDGPASPIPLLMLLGGLAGAGFMFWLQVYADVTAYPIDVGGRPNDSWPAYVTNSFEVGVLAAILLGFAAYLVLNRMPRLYDPIDECDSLRAASRDSWFLSLAPIGGAAAARARALLAARHPLVLQELA